MAEIKSPDIFHFEGDLPKEALATKLTASLKGAEYSVVETDFERPWGGFVKLSDSDAARFIREFFDGVDLPPTTEGATLSPKFLVVEAGKNLSWQVHKRRSELWRVLRGPVGAYRSESDEQPKKPEIFNDGEIIDLLVGTRHRLAGLSDLGIVAEIWIHTDPKNPSDETDIRRIADDFGRQSS